MASRLSRIYRLASMGFVASLLTSTELRADDEGYWPQFRGPQSRGVAAAGDLPDEFGLEQNLIWKTPIPRGVSSPSIWGDRIFLTAHDDDRDALETICVDRITGAIQWRRDTSTEQLERVHKASSAASATPATDGQRVYAYFGSFGVNCYDYAGNLVWSHPLEPVENRWGMGASPILAGGRLIVVCDQGGTMRDGSKSDAVSYVLALDTETGEELWKIDRPRITSGWSTPIVFQPAGEAAPQLVTFSPNRLSGYRLEDGKRLWRLGKLPHDAVATPAVGEGLIFVSGTVFGGDVENPFRLPAYGELLKQYDANKDKRLERSEVPDVSIDPRGRGSQTMTLRHVFDGVDRDKNKVATFFEWTAARVFVALTSRQESGGGKDELVAVRLDGSAEKTEPSVAWSFDRAIPDNPSPLYYKECVYLTKSGGIVSCVNAKTGKALKRKRVSANGKISASPVIGGDRLYICSENGDVVVLDADRQMKQRAHNKLAERIMATPAIAANRLYIRTDDHLYAFGK